LSDGDNSFGTNSMPHNRAWVFLYQVGVFYPL
jgi:hypothetical protein